MTAVGLWMMNSINGHDRWWARFLILSIYGNCMKLHEEEEEEFDYYDCTESFIPLLRFLGLSIRIWISTPHFERLMYLRACLLEKHKSPSPTRIGNSRKLGLAIPINMLSIIDVPFLRVFVLFILCYSSLRKSNNLNKILSPVEAFYHTPLLLSASRLMSLISSFNCLLSDLWSFVQKEKSIFG